MAWTASTTPTVTKSGASKRKPKEWKIAISRSPMTDLYRSSPAFQNSTIIAFSRCKTQRSIEKFNVAAKSRITQEFGRESSKVRNSKGLRQILWCSLFCGPKRA